MSAIPVGKDGSIIFGGQGSAIVRRAGEIVFFRFGDDPGGFLREAIARNFRVEFGPVILSDLVPR